ncbi:hypothetical protein ACQEU6_24480 [Spirillospora sp. CA-108201]
MFDRTFLRHLVRIAVQTAVRVGATAAGCAPTQLAIWWITHM